jgi:thiol-disulfide isomerase/thioredoxin
VDVTDLAGPVVAAGVLAATTGFGLWWRRREGRVRVVTGGPADGQLLAALGVEAGVPVTLLQFSSAFCAPCRATRATCRQLAADQAGVRHVEVDAERHLPAVRALGVWRTPTVFVIDAGGRIVARVTGQPTRGQLTELAGARSARAGHAPFDLRQVRRLRFRPLRGPTLRPRTRRPVADRSARSLRSLDSGSAAGGGA